MVAPLHVFLECFQIRLQFLNGSISVVKNRVELHFRKILSSDFVPRFQSAHFIRIRELCGYWRTAGDPLHGELCRYNGQGAKLRAWRGHTEHVHIRIR